MLFLYRILAYLLAPFWLLHLSLKQRGELRLSERFGYCKAKDRGSIWIHGASVGEAKIALKLAKALGEMGLRTTLTSTTAAGLGLLEQEKGRFSEVRAFPLDLPFAAKNFLDRTEPKALALVETEIWPNLLAEASKRGIPAMIVNGRISDRSLDRSLSFKKLYGAALKGVGVAAQDGTHSKRFEMLGATAGNIEVLGNMKYDLDPPLDFDFKKKELEEFISEKGAFIWVAGSVREGEEVSVLKAHSLLKSRDPRARLIIAPRHLRRASVCVEKAKELGFSVSLRSGGRAVGWDVLILDTIGELWAAYALGSAAFVGGSLVPLGGQNILEPAALGKPVIFGPFMQNFKSEADRLEEAGGAVKIDSELALARTLDELRLDPARADEVGSKARAAIEVYKGASGRTVAFILERSNISC